MKQMSAFHTAVPMESKQGDALGEIFAQPKQKLYQCEWLLVLLFQEHADLIAYSHLDLTIFNK